MGDKNPIHTLRDYSKPSHEGYRNTIELPVGNNVAPLRFDTIQLVQNGCLFHRLRSEDPNQPLKDFLKLMDSLDLDVANREIIRLRLFQFFLRDQASNWLEHLPARSISTWEDLTTRFLAQFFLLGRTGKLRNDILMGDFRLLKELTANRAPKKVLMREETKHPTTKHVNSISLVIVEEKKNVKNNEVVNESVLEPEKLDVAVLPKKINKVIKTKDEPVISTEELVKTPSS
ncbi:zinc finger, CCHC-type containing protein [Tanacetum coccineum]